MDLDIGYEAIDALLGHAASLSFDLDNQSLGHGVLDLARSARREIETVGLKGGQSRIPLNSYEGMLLYSVLPEMACRLMRSTGVEMLKLQEEKGNPEIVTTSDRRLRQIAASCLEHSIFDLIAEKVRDKFDPSYRRRDTFFACEAIERNPLLGNIIEIAATRLSPPDPRSDDFFTRLFALSGVGGGQLRWDPDFIHEQKPQQKHDIGLTA